MKRAAIPWQFQSPAAFACAAPPPPFAHRETPARTLSAGSNLLLNLTLATPTDTQEVTVTATGTPTPLAQVAGAVTVLTKSQYPHVRDIQEPLRFVPGVQVTQTGQRGGATALFIRGGNSNANEVLIDGIAVDDLGGAVDFGNISAAGLAKVEVLREPDSAIYGSEALAGVVSLTTRRGSTPLPFFEYEGDGGNFGTYNNEVSVSGASHRFDYFSDFARGDTGNSVAQSSFHSATFAETSASSPTARQIFASTCATRPRGPVSRTRSCSTAFRTTVSPPSTTCSSAGS